MSPFPRYQSPIVRHSLAPATSYRGDLAMRLPRMTTRRWMVVVAVFGSSIGAYKLWRRRCDFLDQAMLHEAIGETYRYHEREKHDPASAKKTYLLTEWQFVARQRLRRSGCRPKIWSRAGSDRRRSDHVGRGNRPRGNSGQEVSPCCPLPLAPGRARPARAGMNSFGQAVDNSSGLPCQASGKDSGLGPIARRNPLPDG